MNYRWVAVFLCAFASFFLNTISVAFSPILLIVKRDLDLTYTQSGMLTTAYFTGYTIGQIPWGYVTRRLKASRAILLSVLGLAVITFLSTVATTGDTLIATRFFAGLLGAGIFVPGMLLVSEWFPVVGQQRPLQRRRLPRHRQHRPGAAPDQRAKARTQPRQRPGRRWMCQRHDHQVRPAHTSRPPRR